MEKALVRSTFLIFVLAFLIDLALVDFFYEPQEAVLTTVHIDLEALSKLDISSEDLKGMQAYCQKEHLDFYVYLTKTMLYYDFKVPILDGSYKKLSKVPSDPTIESLYHKIFEDLVCFPIMAGASKDKKGYTYTDSFLAERTYGGNRKHMGTDLMDLNNEKGYFKIISMTDGVIEHMGWLELGGYRIGIRSKEGAYFYYAHLNSYAPGLKKGSRVVAGQLLGAMGSSGYGPEGTNDQFDVHLHLGIALDLDQKEFWINPYAILKALDPVLSEASTDGH